MPNPLHRASRLPRPLRLYLLLSACVTLVCVLIELLCHRLALPRIYSDPFFVGIRFYDFDSFQDRFLLLHTPAFFALDKPYPFSYPASAAVLYAALYTPGVASSLNVFLGISIAVLLVFCGLFARSLHRHGLNLRASSMFAASVLALAFPYWFCFQRGNIEVIIFFLLAAGVWAVAADRPWLAAACFGLGASFKMVPAIYLALLLSRRKFAQAAFALLLAVVAEIASLRFIGPTIRQAWQGLADGAATFRPGVILNIASDGIGFDHSIPGLYRRFMTLTNAFSDVLTIYTVIAAVSGLALYLLLIRRLPFINQVLALSTAAIWLPPVSFEYTLMHLYPALALLCLLVVDGAHEGNPREASLRALPFILLIAILTAPLSEFILHGVRFGGQVKSLLLGALFVLALRRPLLSRFDAGLPFSRAARQSPNPSDNAEQSPAALQA